MLIFAIKGASNHLHSKIFIYERFYTIIWFLKKSTGEINHE